MEYDNYQALLVAADLATFTDGQFHIRRDQWDLLLGQHCFVNITQLLSPSSLPLPLSLSSLLASSSKHALRGASSNKSSEPIFEMVNKKIVINGKQKTFYIICIGEKSDSHEKSEVLPPVAR